MTSGETTVTPDPTQQLASDDDALVAEDLVEEVSIDGMCGVY